MYDDRPGPVDAHTVLAMARNRSDTRLSEAISDDGADGMEAAKALGDGLNIKDFSVRPLPHKNSSYKTLDVTPLRAA